MNNREIISSRILHASVAQVYEAFENPNHLKNWWGPEGFTNTIHEFDLNPGGIWKLTMHGREKGNYENLSVFNTVIPNKLVSWTRKSQPLFDMEITFESINEDTTKISFKMIFATADECEKMKKYVEPKNEENFDRLEREVMNIV
ncbi:MAG: SRPBCC domain-containing protein [Bacteroidetes bacterium]|nr:SRPBCC domain-containing protein [Bacteroidota bacterium]